MFSTLANIIYRKEIQYDNAGYLDSDEIDSSIAFRILAASRVLDAITGLALVIIGALSVAGYIPLNSVGCYALLTVGAFEMAALIKALIHVPGLIISANIGKCCEKNKQRKQVAYVTDRSSQGFSDYPMHDGYPVISSSYPAATSTYYVEKK